MDTWKTYIIKLVILIIVVFFLGVMIGYYITEEPAKSKVIEEPISLLIRYNDVHYMFGVATAYTPTAGGINCDTDPYNTATMQPAKNGVIAVNPDIIPYGSEVMIISGNTVIRGKALDTGAAMRENPKQVDILMEELEKAIEWGKRDVHIIWW